MAQLGTEPMQPVFQTIACGGDTCPSEQTRFFGQFGVGDLQLGFRLYDLDGFQSVEVGFRAGSGLRLIT